MKFNPSWIWAWFVRMWVVLRCRHEWGYGPWYATLQMVPETRGYQLAVRKKQCRICGHKRSGGGYITHGSDEWYTGVVPLDFLGRNPNEVAQWYVCSPREEWSKKQDPRYALPAEPEAPRAFKSIYEFVMDDE